jgi:hypothetical protein
MRYKKFVIENLQLVVPGSPPPQKVLTVSEQIDNLNQCKILEVLFYTLAELFEVPNIEIQTTHDAHSFFLVTRDEGVIKHGVNSPWLSREKLKAASPKEVSGAIIDLILHRGDWVETVYKEYQF